MGDDADYTNEMIEEDYISRDLWRRHKIDKEEARDRGILDKFDFEIDFEAE